MSAKPLIPVFVLLCLLVLNSCGIQALMPQPSAGQALVGAGQSQAGTTQRPDDSGWQTIDAAMELRTVRFSISDRSAFATIVRFDPAAYRVSVKYDVANAGTIKEWYDAIQPLAVINGGYFDEAYKPTALVIFDGIKRGESYEGFGGMVVINAQGEFELRSLRQQPYDPNEDLQQAMQSAPMLIQPGGEISDFGADEDRSRRSVIARDRNGRILLIATNTAVFTLQELAQVLKASDLDLDAALNLDGGRSTGLYVRTDGGQIKIDSFEKLPLVLVVDKKP